jgi:hypothetical protein
MTTIKRLVGMLVLRCAAPQTDDPHCSSSGMDLDIRYSLWGAFGGDTWPNMSGRVKDAVVEFRIAAGRCRHAADHGPNWVIRESVRRSSFVPRVPPLVPWSRSPFVPPDWTSHHLNSTSQAPLLRFA